MNIHGFINIGVYINDMCVHKCINIHAYTPHTHFCAYFISALPIAFNPTLIELRVLGP